MPVADQMSYWKTYISLLASFLTHLAVVGIVTILTLVSSLALALDVGCERAFRAMEKRGAHPLVRIDNRAKQRWITDHHRKYLPLARWISNIKMLRQDEVQRLAGKAFSEYLSAHNNERSFVFVTKTLNSSGAWIIGYLQGNFAAARGVRTFDLATEAAELQTYLSDRSESHVVLPNDGIYSGRQEALNVLTHLHGKFRRPQDHIFSTVGFTHKDELVHPHKQVVDSFARIIFGTRMKNIRELLAGESEERRTELHDLISQTIGNHQEYLKQFLNSTLTLTNYKAPDFFSFPPWLVEGISVDVGLSSEPQEARPPIPFIESSGIPWYQR